MDREWECGCGTDQVGSHDDICLRIQLTPPAIFVYPPSTLEGSSLSRYDKIVTGNLQVKCKEETRIGPVKVAWEVWHEPKDLPREVLARFEADVTVGDSTIPKGPSIIPFALTVTHLLPPYTTTPFDAVMNKVFASFLLPVPDYVSVVKVNEASNLDTEGTKSRKASLIHSRSPSVAGSSTPGTPRSCHSPALSESGRATPKKTRLRNLISPPDSSRSSIDEPVDIPQKPAPTNAFARIWRMAQFTLPTTLQPSMAAVWTTCGVMSCPDRPDELPSMEWEKTMRIKGLGKVDVNAYTAYCACGSGLEFDVKFDELNPLATIQSVQLSMAELSIAGDGCAEPGKRDETWFSLFTIGNPDPDAKISSTAEDARVWRGGIPASYDRLSASASASAATSSSTSRIQRWKGKNRDRGRLEQPPSDTGPVYHPDLVDPTMTPLGDSFVLKRQCRLPSPIVGVHSSTPTLLDPRISRVTHRLRVEVLFSVLGLDEHDNPLPVPKSKDKPIQSLAEGTTRRLWVEHAIPLRGCMLGPDSTITPTYDSLPANQSQAESFGDYLARIQIRKEPSAFTVPNSRGRIDLGEGSNDLRERTEEHIDDCQARCLCFYGDNAIYALIARKDRAQSQGDQGGVKSTYKGTTNGG